MTAPIVYPDSDGPPMADNTLQFDWIVKFTGELQCLFGNDPPGKQAVIFGRPQGHRLSYLQWEEGGIPPQVVFEVLSQGNRLGEMIHKFEFYQRYAVEEYYAYDPQRLHLTGFLRNGPSLIEISRMTGHISPRLGVRFEMLDDGLHILRPDGQPLETYREVSRRARQALRWAEQERERAEQAEILANQERQSAIQERQRADRLHAELERLRQQGHA